jgi:hypothetical protein
MKKRVYISGPIEHYDIEERRQVFSNAETYLQDKGYRTFNPLKNGLPPESHWREHMRVDIRALVDCDAIYFLPEWELSKGCKLEFDVATTCNIPILNLVITDTI